MITPTGEYRVDFFNKYGERVAGQTLQARSLHQSTAAANRRLLEPGMLGASYTIMHCIVNTLDKA